MKDSVADSNLLDTAVQGDDFNINVPGFFITLQLSVLSEYEKHIAVKEQLKILSKLINSTPASMHPEIKKVFNV